MDQYEDAAKLRNLFKALPKISKGNMWKDGVALYRSDGLENSVKLRRDMLNGTYKLQRYLHFKITRPKERDITATRIRDRHGQRSACDNILYPALTRSFIYDNGACQRGRGVDYAIDRAILWLRRTYNRQRAERARAANCRPDQIGPFEVEGWVYKGDVRKYFPSSLFSIAKATLHKALDSPRLVAYFCAIVESFGEAWWQQMARKAGAAERDAERAARAITDARTEREYIPIRPEERRTAIAEKCEKQIRRTVTMLPGLTAENRAMLLREALEGDARGIGLGSQLSQLVQLAQLNAIDHFVKESLRVPIYYRYMDDYVMIGSREEIEAAAQAIAEMLHTLGLEVNPKSQLMPLRKGFIFLRWYFCLTPTGKVVLRAAPGVASNEKRRLKRMVRKVQEGTATVASVQTHYEGWRAHIARGNTRELLKSMDKYFSGLLATAGRCEKKEGNHE